MLTPIEALHLTTSDLFEDPDDSSSMGVIVPTSLPDRIGSCSVTSFLGAGGMGAVYQGVQDRPRRRVAIKVLHPSILRRSRSASTRFEYEIELLGRLQHPGIAHVYGAGTHGDGAGETPYFIMEFIEDAHPITGWADHHALSTRSRLELFLKVCDAVHYAHQKGVIHRDLKPENILVGGAGGVTDAADAQPKVIDFGVARSTDADITLATLQSNVNRIVGTVQYMSPEQCVGDVDDLDMRSDVYSLGVVLYELLCARLPYRLTGSSIIAATRAIIESNLKTPFPFTQRTLTKNQRRDLETIVLKAMEKDRQKRYQSAAELRDDVQRFLRGQPIEARPPNRLTLACRWIARHPVLGTAALCAVLVVLTIASTALAVWQLRLKPHQVVLSDDGSHVRLVSVTGETLRRWDVRLSMDESIQGAIMATRPYELGGGHVVAIGVNPTAAASDGRSLAVFSVGRRAETPLWTAGISDVELPDELVARGFSGRDFGVNVVRAFDVFPDLPSPQIVASFHHKNFSQGVVRIYDLSGELLYQFWHDGPISALHWMPQAKLLVCGGLNGEAYLEQRGMQGRFAHPRVVFAVKPIQGLIDRGWLVTPGSVGSQVPVWYKCLLPSEHFDRAPRLVTGPARTGQPDHTELTFSIMVDLDYLVQQWTIDRNGKEVPGTRAVSDNWLRASGAPDPHLFHLGDLPPVLPEWRDVVGPGRPAVPVHPVE